MHPLLHHQSGVVSRAQLEASGLRPHDIERLIRGRLLARVHPGVYVDHTGPLAWQQRAWAAVLACRGRGPGSDESAALAGASALRAADGIDRHTERQIEIVVSTRRRITPHRSVRLLRSSAVLATAQWHLGPPRVPYDDAVVAVASRQQRTVDVVAELSRAVGSRRTTSQRLLACAQSTPRAVRRSLLVSLLGDIAQGTCSTLEHGYLVRVERAHGLPTAQRQQRGQSRTGLVYRDATYDRQIVELDGRAWHDSVEQRDRDADRDLLAAVSGRSTVRLGWGQVFDRPCWTAAQVARILGARVRPCGGDCSAPTS